MRNPNRKAIAMSYKSEFTARICDSAIKRSLPQFLRAPARLGLSLPSPLHPDNVFPGGFTRILRDSKFEPSANPQAVALQYLQKRHSEHNVASTENDSMQAKAMAFLLLLSFWTTLPAAFPQDSPTENPEPAETHYLFNPENHDPNGIGKFYMGREIAHVMGYPAASWLERPEREKEESLTKLVDALKLKPGMVVADIGAGSG